MQIPIALIIRLLRIASRIIEQPRIVNAEIAEIITEKQNMFNFNSIM